MAQFKPMLPVAHLLLHNKPAASRQHDKDTKGSNSTAFTPQLALSLQQLAALGSEMLRCMCAKSGPVKPNGRRHRYGSCRYFFQHTAGEPSCT